VLDSAARLPVSSNLALTAREVPVLVAVTERATPSRREELARIGCDIVAYPGADRVPVLALLRELGQRGMTNLLVEGGGQVVGSFLDADQVDALDVFIAPTLEGGDHARTAARGQGCTLMSEAIRLRAVEVTQIGDEVRVRGWLPQSWRMPAGFHDE
jgi:diaminohydroxyphosphoribosylaminopyrimidine deaminase/5-amino-6-(5-phosphoribosylamino)uracil reductase